MPRYSKETLAQAEQSLPSSDAVRAIVDDYRSKTGLSPADFAHRIGYSYASVRTFIEDRYTDIAKSDIMLRSAIMQFVTTHPVTPSVMAQGKMYETQNVKLIRQHFYSALDHGRAYYFQGAPGTQKTFVIKHLIAELNRNDAANNGHGRRAYYVYCREASGPRDLLRRIAFACGVRAAGIDATISNLRFEFARRRALLYLDETQHISRTCLEVVRELYDEPPHFGLLFGGSHQVEEMFARMDMQQWHSRLRKGERLPGIQEDEARNLIIPGELGKVSKAQEDWLVKQSYDIDQVIERKGVSFKAERVQYISARKLFDAIAVIKEEREKKASK
ncbi:MAG TPA: ATP-binding protein [Candidatus Angelobacter sp.]|nr:ATP-binding protein [Candidatus Angelobacter sp.]